MPRKILAGESGFPGQLLSSFGSLTWINPHIKCKSGLNSAPFIIIMRLFNTKTFEIQTFISDTVPDYVILSHRWSRGEVTYQALAKDPISNPNSEARKLFGFAKVQGACHQATIDGYDWIWIDSCCIDQSSSSELQEAINSMWNHYA